MSAGPGPGALAVLRRFAGTAPAPVTDERCELCGVPVGGEHSHVVDLSAHSLLCACRPCWLLFPEGAQQRYRAVPERYLSFPGGGLSPGQWAALEIPVGLVFLFRSSSLGRPVALYPGPAGATESELPLGSWDDVLAAAPALAALVPDVEALLVRADGRGVPVCFLVPIDRCYELVGRLRRVWRGFDGGAEARAEIEAFLADVAARSRPAPGSAP